MKETKLISVVIPVFNAEAFVEECLESVIASVSNFSFEIIAINDGSTDESLKVLRKWENRIKIFSQKNKGSSAARNLGIRMSKGKYIAFIDADDIWPAEHIKVLLGKFKDKKMEISMGYSQRIFADKKLYEEPVLIPTFGCAIFKSSVFDKVGLIDERYPWHEDVDWYFRSREKKVKICVTRKVVNYYRLHDKNTTKQGKPDDKKILKVISESLARRNGKKLQALESYLNEEES